MPRPRKGESRKDFVTRCIPHVMQEGTAKNSQEAVAICNSLYESEQIDLMTSELTQLTESTFGDPEHKMQVDREAQVIHGVKCLGRESKNGRVYTDQALADARSFYEGIDVNVDHPTETGHERQMADGFGVLRNVQIVNEGVFADLHYLKAHHLADVILERAERIPGNFGMSHNATGRVREDPKLGKLVVEGLERVESVDIVSRPATSKGLFESEQGRNAVSNDKGKKTVREVLEAQPKNKQAAAILLLLEEESFAAVADAPMENSEAATKDSVKAVLRKLVIAAFDDDSLDTAATLQRIKKIIQSQDKLLAQLAPGGEEGGGNASSDAMESIRTEIVAALAPIAHREAVRDLLEEKGLRRSDLSAAQWKILDRQQEIGDISDFLEAWDIRPAASERPRPAISSRRLAEAEGDNGKTYDELKESVRPKAPVTR